MRKYLLAAVAASAVSSPGFARDGSPYVAIEGGINCPENKDVNGSAAFATRTGIGSTPLGRIRFNQGYDVDLIGGYDLGMFRVEGELGYKHSKVKSFNLNSAYLNGINAASGHTFNSGNDLGFTRSTSVLSAMINGMVDFGDNAGWSGFAGGGIGYAHFKELGDSQSKPAWQAIAGVRAAVTDTIDVGIKYRYVRGSVPAAPSREIHEIRSCLSHLGRVRLPRPRCCCSPAPDAGRHRRSERPHPAAAYRDPASLCAHRHTAC